MRILTINEFKALKLLEAAVSIDSIIDSNLVLIRSLSKNEIKLCLFDYVTQDIYAYITAFKVANDIFQIDRTSAEKGYGPLIYDILLQELNPYGLKPANKIKQEAMNVWKYYFTKRSDVSKVSIPENNPAYNEYYVENDSDDAQKLTDKENLSIINTVYKMNKTAEYVHFITESEHIIKEKNINKNNVFKNALSYFQQKYYGANASYIFESLDVPEDAYFLRKGFEFCLTTKSKILAYANVLKHEGYYIFDKIYGPGYGLMMHKLVLMALSPIPVRPSASSKQSVISIWKKLKKGAEVKNVTDKWPYYDDGIIPKQTIDLDVVNVAYTMKPDQEFKQLIEKSKQFESVMNNIVQDYVEKRMKIGKSMYTDSYIEI